MDEFIRMALRTESLVDRPLATGEMRLLHAGMGLATEAGEFLDALKKSIFYGKPMDLVNLREELGDILWYMAIAMDELGTNFFDEQDRVIRKLRVRYPDKFNIVDANLRDLEGERRVLET